MKDFVTRQNHTNLVVLNIPYRHGIQESSCVNSAVGSFNRKLMKCSKAFDNLHFLGVEYCRDLYTNHGLHLNWKGKEVMSRKIVNAIKDILNVQKLAPIGIKWKDEEMTGSIQSDNCEKGNVKKVNKLTMK
jgi:hypothetical protein